MNNDFTINQLPAKNIQLEGGEYHFFSGTSYLGMNQDEDFKQLFIKGLNQYGMSFGSSRNGNLQLDIYDDAETKLAAWVGTQKALTVSSGMLAGQLVAQYLKTQNSTFFYAPQSHSANFHKPNITLPTISFDEWTRTIIEEIQHTNAQNSVIICNSTDALRVSKYDFSWTQHLPENQEITLVIDDSHGLGITGINGAGIYQQIKVKPNVRLVIVSSLHKAMGIAGGVIFGDTDFIDKLRHTAFFASCSPIAPAYLYAYLHADEIYERNLHKLRTNIQHFISQLAINNQTVHQLFNFLPNYPVFYTTHDDLYKFLFQNNIFIYSFAYPIKSGKPNTRIVLSAWHDTDQIDFLAEQCNKYLKTKE